MNISKEMLMCLSIHHIKKDIYPRDHPSELGFVPDEKMTCVSIESDSMEKWKKEGVKKKKLTSP